MVERTTQEMTNPRWLKLTAACRYAAIRKTRLLRLVKEGYIKGFQEDNGRGDWIVDRLSAFLTALFLIARHGLDGAERIADQRLREAKRRLAEMKGEMNDQEI
jgi:hypothetical protein